MANKQYRINLHSHTIFSDGANTPLAMAMEAKMLGHSALVITDHYFGKCNRRTLDQPMMSQVKKACKEAAKVLPVIIGIELNFAGVEMLAFGPKMIEYIMRHRDAGHELTVALLLRWKLRYDGAFILCHPGDPEYWPKVLPLLDGFERYNSGKDQFRHRGYGILEGLPQWCNSDAHQVAGLARAWNETRNKITNTGDLVQYIRKGNQPIHYLEVPSGK